MGFSHRKPSAFRVEEFDLLRTLSHLISAGLEKAALFKKTLELARVDELTGLLNYRVLIEKLEEEVRRKVRTGREFCFIMIDIDDFKRINDRYGHLEGSRLIAQMGPLSERGVQDREHGYLLPLRRGGILDTARGDQRRGSPAGRRAGAKVH